MDVLKLRSKNLGMGGFNHSFLKALPALAVVSIKGTVGEGVPSIPSGFVEVLEGIPMGVDVVDELFLGANRRLGFGKSLLLNELSEFIVSHLGKSNRSVHLVS